MEIEEEEGGEFIGREEPREGTAGERFFFFIGLLITEISVRKLNKDCDGVIIR